MAFALSSAVTANAGVAVRRDGAVGGCLADDAGVRFLRMGSAECHGAKYTDGNGRHELRCEADSVFLVAINAGFLNDFHVCTRGFVGTQARQTV